MTGTTLRHESATDIFWNRLIVLQGLHALLRYLCRYKSSLYSHQMRVHLTGNTSNSISPSSLYLFLPREALLMAISQLPVWNDNRFSHPLIIQLNGDLLWNLRQGEPRQYPGNICLRISIAESINEISNWIHPLFVPKSINGKPLNGPIQQNKNTSLFLRLLNLDVMKNGGGDPVIHLTRMRWSDLNGLV